MSQPPPLPARQSKMPRRAKALITLGVFAGVCCALLIVLRLSGLLRPFVVPTGAMSPAVRPGDHIFMEGISYLHGNVERGEIIVFKTEKIPGIQRPATIYLKRAAGLPGERIRLDGGALFINGRRVSLTNASGEIRYANMAGFGNPATTLTVPDGHYFVLGDTSTNSYDGRYWGFVPREAVMGRAFICYWPPLRIGCIK